MTLTTRKLVRAYDVLTQGMVCLDDNLRQGVFVYVESLLVAHSVKRKNYLTLDDLRCDYPFVRMGSYMPIDFFGQAAGEGQTTGCIDASFKPVSIKMCSVSHRDGHMPTHNWELVGTFRDVHILEAIDALLDILSNEEYFDYCTHCNQITPVGMLDQYQVCGYCCEELLGVA